MVVNRLMKQGKAVGVSSLLSINGVARKETRRDPLLLLEEAIRNVTPTMR
jgi:ribosomal protein S7